MLMMLDVGYYVYTCRIWLICNLKFVLILLIVAMLNSVKKKNAVFITITIDVDLLPQTKFFKILHDSLYVIVS